MAIHVVPALVSSHRPPVLLIHGAANSSGVWRFWQEALADLGWSSYAVDLRGHGRSSGSIDGATMSDDLPIRPGVFGPEEYGITSLDPATQPSMPDLNTQERAVALESASQESWAARAAPARRGL